MKYVYLLQNGHKKLIIKNIRTFIVFPPDRELFFFLKSDNELLIFI